MVVQAGDLFVQPHFRRIRNSFKLRLGAVFYFAGVRGQTEPVIHTNSINAFI